VRGNLRRGREKEPMRMSDQKKTKGRGSDHEEKRRNWVNRFKLVGTPRGRPRSYD